MSESLVCHVDTAWPAAVLRAEGRLDMDTAPTLRTAVHKCLAGEPDAVVIDLGGLEVGDDIALTVFTALAATAAQWPGLEVILCAASPQVARHLDRMAILRTVRLCATRDAALGRAADPRPPRRLRMSLPPAPTSCPEARYLVDDACTRWGVPELAGRAEVIVTELVANVVRHAGTRMTVTVSLRDRYLGVAVRDGSSRVARLRGPDTPDSLNGRGLMVVEAMSSSWGCIPTSEGKVVWAALRLGS